ncbi:MAG TPA: hypothetical protein VFD49_24555 [Candidatus Dormibacteraeota bacterium]|nr:hypothetical protein [Candidatus Dormibacteraeota bacterium]
MISEARTWEHVLAFRVRMAGVDRLDSLHRLETAAPDLDLPPLGGRRIVQTDADGRAWVGRIIERHWLSALPVEDEAEPQEGCDG